MKWSINYLPEAEKDLRSFSHYQILLIRKAIAKVQENPLPQSEGGYGKPLGHKGSSNLTTFLKVKIRGAGIRIVYKLLRTETTMLIVVIGIREDEVV